MAKNRPRLVSANSTKVCAIRLWLVTLAKLLPGYGRLWNVPLTREQTAASRADPEIFLKKTGAQLWIEHDIIANAKLKKAPGFYD